jgi:hypothetical protein
MSRMRRLVESARVVAGIKSESEFIVCVPENATLLERLPEAMSVLLEVPSASTDDSAE